MDRDPVPHSSAHCSPEELARFSVGALPPRRQKRVQRHLESCPACRQSLQEIAGIPTLLRQAPGPLPPRSLTLSRQDLRRRRRRLWYPLLRSATVAAATIVLVILLTGLLEPTLLDEVWSTGRAGEIEPTPPPVAVKPASTSRPRPTLVGAPRATAAPTLRPAGMGPGPAYPQPTVAAPQIEGPVTPPAAPAGRSPLWSILHLGALALLGLLAGLTWLAYRRERAFFG